METSFTDESHRGALRCLSVSRNGVLASSSTDDSIRLHNLRKRKEIGGLFEHTGTVNYILFFQASHMFSASDDGTICMWKCKNWEMLRNLKGHKSQVMAFAIHPSGKLGLSVGSDKSFITWDLVTGKLAFQRKTKDVAQNILFTPSGDHYILVYFKQIEICSLADTKTVQEIATNWRINAVCLLQENVLAIGGDDRFIRIVDILKGQTLMTLDVAKPVDNSFNSRVKGICVVENGEEKLVIAAATANGNVKMFRVALKDKKGDVLMFYETKVRVTCMAVYNHQKNEEESKVPESVPVKKTAKKSKEEGKIKSQPQKSLTQTSVQHVSIEDEEQSDGMVADSGDKKCSPHRNKMNRKRKMTKDVDKSDSSTSLKNVSTDEKRKPISQLPASRKLKRQQQTDLSNAKSFRSQAKASSSQPVVQKKKKKKMKITK